MKEEVGNGEISDENINEIIDTLDKDKPQYEKSIYNNFLTQIDYAKEKIKIDAETEDILSNFGRVVEIDVPLVLDKKFHDKNKEESALKGKKPVKRKLLISVYVLIFLFLAGFLIYAKLYSFLAALAVLLVLIFGYFIVRVRLKKYADVKKMEDVFPDFISLTASNLRAGLTIDRALLLSARKEFAPLDKEIMTLGKDIVTGKEIEKAMLEMAGRIKSEDVRKTILLIITGIKSGGNLSILLEQVSSSMRERIFVKKKAASNVLMYVIFIFFAVAVGAPFLFALSSVLVEILTTIIVNIPAEQISSTAAKLPFTLTSINISVNFVKYFAAVFIVVTDILASLVLGLVSKGKEREGFKYIFPLIAFSLGVYFGARYVVGQYFADFFG